MVGEAWSRWYGEAESNFWPGLDSTRSSNNINTAEHRACPHRRRAFHVPCSCLLEPFSPFFSPTWASRFPAEATTTASFAPSSRTISNDAGRQSQPEEMESTGDGPLAALSANQLSSHVHPLHQSHGMIMDHHLSPHRPNPGHSPGPEHAFSFSGEQSTPQHLPFVNHFEPSNVRGSAEELPPAPNPARSRLSPIAATSADIDPATRSPVFPQQSDQSVANLGEYDPIYDQYGAALDHVAALGAVVEDNPFADEEDVDETTSVDHPDDPEPVQAFAKLVFPDGDCYITTFQLMLCRDMTFYHEWLLDQKRARRAQKALDEYALEPSQPSQPDDAEVNRDPSSKSSQSLVGRPAKALPSNYSEQGGAVSYAAHSDGELQSRRSGRKRKNISKSSSTTSVAPASLHPNMMGSLTELLPFSAEAGALPNLKNCERIGIHPANRDDIRLISKEHLLFQFNFQDERWELHVLGKDAYHNNTLHPRGSVIPLEHNDNIIVTSISIDFKLPDHGGLSPMSRGTFADSDLEEEDLEDDEDEDEESAIGTSPVRRLSTAMAAMGSDDDADDDDDEDEDNSEGSNDAAEEKDEQEEEGMEGRAVASKQPKLKLSLKNNKIGNKNKKESARNTNKVSKAAKDKPVKLNLKKQGKRKEREESTEQSPEATKNAGKGKKKISTKQPPKQPEEEAPDECHADDVKDEMKEDQKLSPSIAPANLEPGSIFEGVAVEELPQKRKGPGRPPKNGLISKRDQSFVKRKLKEYEKRGEQPPPMDELVAIVRAENKAKEAATKAAARGEAPADANVVQSIEMDPTSAAGATPSTSKLTAGATLTATTQAELDRKSSATPTETARKPSPKPAKPIVKSPSPVKAESEYTEEELKKPTITYVHILDEILKAHPAGRADLPDIYDRIYKRWPYFKYRVTTAGWQSSVRHNLLQHGRFRENGRSGKGRLWAINFACPLDKEKKRRITPPPRPPMPPMHNGHFPHGQNGHLPQYGQPNYNTPYGQPQLNGVPPFNLAPQPGSGMYYSPYGPSQPGPYGHPAAQSGASPVAPLSQTPGSAPSQTPQQSQALAQPASGPVPPQQQPIPSQSQQQQRAPAASQTQFQGIVDEIMVYRSQYLARFPHNSETFHRHDELFRKCTTFISNIFHGVGVGEGELNTEEERRVYADLQRIFERYQHLRGPPASSSTPTAEAGAAGETSSGGIGQAVGRATDKSGEAEPATHQDDANAMTNGHPLEQPLVSDAATTVSTNQHHTGQEYISGPLNTSESEKPLLVKQATEGDEVANPESLSGSYGVQKHQSITAERSLEPQRSSLADSSGDANIPQLDGAAALTPSAEPKSTAAVPRAEGSSTKRAAEEDTVDDPAAKRVRVE